MHSKFIPCTANPAPSIKLEGLGGREAPSILLAIDGSSALVTRDARHNALKGRQEQEEGGSGDPPCPRDDTMERNDIREAAKSKTEPNSTNLVLLEAAANAGRMP